MVKEGLIVLQMTINIDGDQMHTQKAPSIYLIKTVYYVETNHEMPIHKVYQWQSVVLKKHNITLILLLFSYRN